MEEIIKASFLKNLLDLKFGGKKCDFWNKKQSKQKNKLQTTKKFCCKYQPKIEAILTLPH